MYWARSTRVQIIADTMTRNLFFKIRSNLKVVRDEDVSKEIKQSNHLWRIMPFLDRIREGCLNLPRPPHVSVDEMMIPFSGNTKIKQFVKGKPNPEGVKVFVLASQIGMVLDFIVYQGKGTLPPNSIDEFGVGGNVVIHLSQSLLPGHHIFFDRFFTSPKLMKCLLEKGFYSTGTIMPNKIKSAPLELDKLLLRKGRGSSSQIVSPDNDMCIVKWFDNKPVLCCSTAVRKHPEGKCTRWSKQVNKRIDVKRPKIIEDYNRFMGGVDLADHLISYYRINQKLESGRSEQFCIF